MKAPFRISAVILDAARLRPLDQSPDMAYHSYYTRMIIKDSFCI